MANGDGTAYDPGDYPRFAVTVDIAVFTIRDDALQVLLIQRGGEPYLGAWALPGGFVRLDEDLDQAAARELAEETGLRTGSWYLEQLGSYGSPDRDPRMRVVTVAYWAICADMPAPRGGGDALAAALTPVRDIERGAVRLAFDHERIVRDAVERTRSKLEYTALAARFCPPEFTIRQLRRVYEAVWNTRLDPGNFQRGVQESGVFVRQSEVPDGPLRDADSGPPPGAASGPPPGAAGGPAPASAPARPPRRGRPAALWSIGAGSSDDLRDAAPLARPPAKRRRAARRTAQDAAASPAASQAPAADAEGGERGDE